MDKFYQWPKLPYDYKDLAPYISEKQLMIHHQKHHQAYVKGVNAILEKLEESRKQKKDLAIKAILKELSFNLGGHILHSLFWENMAQAGRSGGGKPQGALVKALNSEFGSFERFKQEFSQVALTTEGSGWVALACDGQNKKLLLMQIEKHNLYLYPDFKILLVLDVWEHAYYLDYQNERLKFIEAFWQLVRWGEVARRFSRKEVTFSP